MTNLKPSVKNGARNLDDPSEPSPADLQLGNIKKAGPARRHPTRGTHQRHPERSPNQTQLGRRPAGLFRRALRPNWLPRHHPRWLLRYLWQPGPADHRTCRADEAGPAKRHPN